MGTYVALLSLLRFWNTSVYLVRFNKRNCLSIFLQFTKLVGLIKFSKILIFIEIMGFNFFEMASQ